MTSICTSHFKDLLFSYSCLKLGQLVLTQFLWASCLLGGCRKLLARATKTVFILSVIPWIWYRVRVFADLTKNSWFSQVMGVYSVFVCQLVAQVCSPSNVCAGVYTLTECVTQCANVPIPKMNTRHHANHALSRICETKHTCDTTYTSRSLCSSIIP